MDFYFFAKTIAKNISKNLSGKYNQKLFGGAKRSGIDGLQTAP